MTKEPTEKRSAGRPPIELDESDLRKLLAMQCSDPQVAGWFEISLRSLYNLKKREPYKTIFETHRERGKALIKMALFDEAVNKRNVTALIWLDKTICGTKPAAQHVIVTPTKPIHEMTDEELAAIAAGSSTGAANAEANEEEAGAVHSEDV